MTILLIPACEAFFFPADSPLFQDSARMSPPTRSSPSSLARLHPCMVHCGVLIHSHAISPTPLGTPGGHLGAVPGGGLRHHQNPCGGEPPLLR